MLATLDLASARAKGQEGRGVGTRQGLARGITPVCYTGLFPGVEGETGQLLVGDAQVCVKEFPVHVTHACLGVFVFNMQDTS